MRKRTRIGVGGRVRTDTITISIQTIPDLGWADNVDLVWGARMVDVEG